MDYQKLNKDKIQVTSTRVVAHSPIKLFKDAMDLPQININQPSSMSVLDNKTLKTAVFDFQEKKERKKVELKVDKKEDKKSFGESLANSSLLADLMNDDVNIEFSKEDVKPF